MEPNNNQKNLLIWLTLILVLLNPAAICVAQSLTYSPSPGSVSGPASSPLGPESDAPSVEDQAFAPAPSPGAQLDSNEEDQAFAPVFSPGAQPHSIDDLSPSNADLPASLISAPIPSPETQPNPYDLSPSNVEPPNSLAAPVPSRKSSLINLPPSIADPPANLNSAPMSSPETQPNPIDFTPSIADTPGGLFSAPTPSPETNSNPVFSPSIADPPGGHSSAPAQSPENPFASSPEADRSPSSDDDAPSTSPLGINLDIKKICDSTDYPKLCQSFSPSFNGKTDVASFLEVTINDLTQQTKLAITAATKLATAGDTPSRKVPILEDCRDIYEDALASLQGALEAIRGHDIDTFKIMLTAAMTDYGTCDDGFRGQSPMASYGDKLRQMTSNCLAIASSIE